jgi:hypothetical protein
MWGVEPKRIAAAFAATAAAMVTMAARADDLPGMYGGHGVTFAYPTTWLHVPAQFDVQSGTQLWSEFFGPEPAPPADPTNPTATVPAQPAPMQRDLVAVAAYKTNIAVTKKTLPRYKASISYFVLRLATQAGGTVLKGPQRVTMGGLPGYRYQMTADVDNGTVLESRVVLVFKGRTEFFLNCQHVQGGPLTAEIEGGCDQLMKSFKLLK